MERRNPLKLAERYARGRLLPGSVLERAGRPEVPTTTTLARRHTTDAIALDLKLNKQRVELKRKRPVNDLAPEKRTA